MMNLITKYSLNGVARADDGTTGTGEKATRKNVSKRDYLLGDKVVDKIEEADGARYTLLNTDGKPFKDFDQALGEPGKFATMCAIIGFHTKIGNVANTILNDKENTFGPADAADSIAEFIADAEGGVWADRTGGAAAKIDKPALAAAYVEYCAERGVTKDVNGVLKQFEEKPVLVRQLRATPQIATLYAAKVGKPVKSEAEILDLVK